METFYSNQNGAMNRNCKVWNNKQKRKQNTLSAKCYWQYERQSRDSMRPRLSEIQHRSRYKPRFYHCTLVSGVMNC